MMSCMQYESESEYYSDIATSDEASDMPDYDDQSADNYWPSCNQSEYKIQKQPNGEIIVIEIPIACSEFYLYKGYPNPDKQKVESPNGINVNPESM
ncbi:MAG: hypothetical protein Q8P20_00225 [bacterium]|nr:hypothetical protein [bacterium]